MALTKHGIRANGLSFFRDQTVERERRGKERRRRRGRREEEKKRRSQDQAKRYGTNLGYEL